MPCLRLFSLALLAAIAVAGSFSASGAVASAQTEPPPPRQPISPAGYTLPSPHIVVSSSTELARLLANGRSDNIVIADGIYDAAQPFANTEGDRLFAEHLGRSVFKTGMFIGGNSGAGGGSIQGLRFDITSLTKAAQGGAIHVWGEGGKGTRVLDVTVDGHKKVAVGLLVYAPQGFVARRLKLRSFTDVALRVSDNRTVSYGAATPHIRALSDIDVDGVSRAIPGSSNGTGEAGLFIGHPVDQPVERIRIRNVAWSGIETVSNSWNSVYRDLDIDMSGVKGGAQVGIYLERYNYAMRFERFSIRGARTGINAEWADPAQGGVSASHRTTIMNGTIDATSLSPKMSTTGIYLDEGTERTTVRGVLFKGQSWAGIGSYKNTGVNSFTGNRYVALRGSAETVSYSHP